MRESISRSSSVTAGGFQFRAILFLLAEAPGGSHFYPRANTPGCTNESKDFSTHYQAFKEAGCEVFGVSMDSLKKQQNFKNKYDMPFELIADTDEWLCQELDVIKEKKMYGKTFMGIERSTFIVNSAGEILKTWRKVKVPGHVEEVLDAVKALS